MVSGGGVAPVTARPKPKKKGNDGEKGTKAARGRKKRDDEGEAEIEQRGGKRAWDGDEEEDDNEGEKGGAVKRVKHESGEESKVEDST